MVFKFGCTTESPGKLKQIDTSHSTGQFNHNIWGAGPRLLHFLKAVWWFSCRLRLRTTAIEERTDKRGTTNNPYHTHFHSSKILYLTLPPHLSPTSSTYILPELFLVHVQVHTTYICTWSVLTPRSDSSFSIWVCLGIVILQEEAWASVFAWHFTLIKKYIVFLAGCCGSHL